MNRQAFERIVVILAASVLSSAPSHAATSTSGACVGDCNGDGVVEVQEVITAVNIDLGLVPGSACQAVLVCGVVKALIPCEVQAVNNLLYGCK